MGEKRQPHTSDQARNDNRDHSPSPRKVSTNQMPLLYRRFSQHQRLI